MSTAHGRRLRRRHARFMRRLDVIATDLRSMRRLLRKMQKRANPLDYRQDTWTHSDSGAFTFGPFVPSNAGEGKP